MQDTTTTTPITEEPVCQDTQELISLMVSEVEAGRPGKRIRTETGDWLSDPSTYPSWMGENGLTRKKVLHAYQRYQQEGKKLQAYRILEEVAERAFEFGQYRSPFFGTIKLREDTMTETKTLQDFNRGEERGAISPREKIEGQKQEVKQGQLPHCGKCGGEVENNRIEVRGIKSGKQEIYSYHRHCYVCLTPVTLFQFKFEKPDRGKSPRVDVALNGEAYPASSKIKHKILEICHLLEKKYQNSNNC